MPEALLLPLKPSHALTSQSLLCFLALTSQLVHQQPLPLPSLASMKPFFFYQSLTPLYQWLVYYFFHR